MKKTYDWVLSWANSPFGTIALFFLAFAESSFFPIPPDVLLIALALGKRKKSFYYAFICSLGSILGGIFGYYIGSFLWYSGNDYSSVAKWFFDYIPGFSELRFEHIRDLYENYSFWVVFTAGFSPIPYKLITITAGVCKINFFIFLLASSISRSARFFLVAMLIFIFGERIKNFIDKYFNMLTLVFTSLLIGGFLILKYFVK